MTEQELIELIDKRIEQRFSHRNRSKLFMPRTKISQGITSTSYQLPRALKCFERFHEPHPKNDLTGLGLS